MTEFNQLINDQSLVEQLAPDEQEFIDLKYRQKLANPFICSRLNVKDPNEIKLIDAKIAQKLVQLKSGSLKANVAESEVYSRIEKNESVLTLSLYNLEAIIKRADGIFFHPELEKFLQKLIYHEKRVKEAKKILKEILKEKALEVEPLFKSITSDNITCYLSESGKKYSLDTESLSADDYKLAMKELNTLGLVKITIVPDSKAIDEYVKDHAELPSGLMFNANRKKGLTFKLKKDAEALERKLESGEEVEVEDDAE